MIGSRHLQVFIDEIGSPLTAFHCHRCFMPVCYVMYNTVTVVAYVVSLDIWDALNYLASCSLHTEREQTF